MLFMAFVGDDLLMHWAPPPPISVFMDRQSSACGLRDVKAYVARHHDPAKVTCPECQAQLIAQHLRDTRT